MVGEEGLEPTLFCRPPAQHRPTPIITQMAALSISRPSPPSPLREASECQGNLAKSSHSHSHINSGHTSGSEMLHGLVRSPTWAPGLHFSPSASLLASFLLSPPLLTC